jgi:glucokinase
VPESEECSYRGRCGAKRHGEARAAVGRRRHQRSVRAAAARHSRRRAGPHDHVRSYPVSPPCLRSCQRCSQLLVPGTSWQRSYPTVAADAVAGSGSCMEALVVRFLAEAPAEARQPEQCVLAVCGPVVEGEAYCASQVMMDTTGPWKFTETSVGAAAGGVPTLMLNDFVAVGHALSAIPPDKLHCLHPAAAASKAPEQQVIACLGPGTGLGNVYAVWDSGLGRRKVLPSEGSMGHFVPRSQLQWDCLQSVAATEGFVPVDRMLGGQGIASWYQFLGEENTGGVL